MNMVDQNNATLASPKPRRDAPKIALISPCGWGNLGDAAILDATIHHIRQRRPDCEIIAFTMNPPDTARRHGVAAFPIAAHSLPGYGIRDQHGEPPSVPLERIVRPLERLSWRLSCTVRRLLVLASAPAKELRHTLSSFRSLAGCTDLIVCGGGQLDEFWGGPWGHPFALWKFACLAQIRGARLSILSVGSARLATRLGRWFAGRALRSSSYRSFRERYAVDLANDLGAPPPVHWCPDLAFALPFGSARPRSTSRRRRIGVSPIAWCDPRVWPDSDPARFEQYLGRLADLIRRLLRRGDDVVMFASDSPDHHVISDLQSRLNDRRGEDLGRLTVVDTRAVPDLLDCLSTLDVAFVSRLHGLILAYVAGTPAVALSYDPKVDSLMNLFGAENCRLEIASFDAEAAVHNLDRVLSDRRERCEQIQRRLNELREMVFQQFDATLGSHAHGAPVPGDPMAESAPAQELRGMSSPTR